MDNKPKMVKFNADEGRATFTALRRYYTIIAPIEKPGKGRFSDTSIVVYGPVESFDEIEFFKKTYFSAKEIVFPVREEMFSLQDNQMKEADSQMRPTIIFLRSCDIHALKVMDTHFLGGTAGADIYYKRRREKIKIFLIECESPFENCFCVSLETNKTDSWSAFMRKKEYGYEIIIKDEGLKDFFPAGVEDVSGPRFARENAFAVRFPDKIDSAVFENDIWKDYTSRCIACGRCTASCPTCGCFTAQDILGEDKRGGERKRIWSSCMVRKFGLLAGNHDFRVKEGDRLRYMILHKIYDFRKRQGLNMCVGCGRCDDVCPEYISTLKCVEKINRIMEAPAANG